MAFRREKVVSALRNVASDFLKSKSFKGMLISVTRVEASNDFRRAKIFITIFPENRERETIDSLRKELGSLRDYFKSHLKMKFLPHFEIEIDRGEKNRQRIEEILCK